MARTVDECKQMIDACRDSNVKLMIAYRLHFEGPSLEIVDLYVGVESLSRSSAEPKEVMAIAVNSGERRLREIDESTEALLRFDGERLAGFVTSFNSADVGEFRIVGTVAKCGRIRPSSTPKDWDTR